MREAGVELLPLRKKNSLRPVPPYMTYLQASIRKVVETTGSLIERLLPRSCQCVPAEGFGSQGHSFSYSPPASTSFGR